MRELFATTEVEAHVCNQGVINTIADINKVGTTTHDEWYTNLYNNNPTLDK